MTELNFEGMTRQELLTYVRQHPEDTKAFHKYVDMFRASPTRIKVSADKVADELAKVLGTN